MAWDVPNFFIPVQPNQGAQIASYADRLMGAFDQGQASRRQQDVLNARKALGAEMAQGGPANYQSYAARLMGNGDLEGANTFMRLGQQDVQNNFERERIDIARQHLRKDDQPKYGLNPIYGTDDQGNPVVMQPGTNGQLVRSQTPQGVTVSQKPIQIDAGTHFVLIDPITRQPITTIPKNVAGAAQQKAAGTAAGEAQAALPGAEGMAGQINQHIDGLLNDSYLPNMVGPLASRMPNVTGDAARVQSRMDQLGGGAFLQARGMLKGGGAITDFESKQAEAAFARLSTAQNLEDYKAALGEFRNAINDGLAKLRQQGAMVPGGGQPAAVPSPSAAGQAPTGGGLTPGAAVNGFIYRGGNPKDPNSWERAQ